MAKVISVTSKPKSKWRPLPLDTVVSNLELDRFYTLNFFGKNGQKYVDTRTSHTYTTIQKFEFRKKSLMLVQAACIWPKIQLKTVLL